MSKNIFKFILLFITFFVTSPSLIYYLASFNSIKIFIIGLIAIIIFFTSCAKLIISPPKFLEIISFKWDKYILSVALALIFSMLNLGLGFYTSMFFLPVQQSQTGTSLPLGIYFLSPILIFFNFILLHIFVFLCFIDSILYKAEILYKE